MSSIFSHFGAGIIMTSSVNDLSEISLFPITSTSQTEKSIVKGLGWAVSSIAAVGAATAVGTLSIGIGAMSAFCSLDSLESRDLFDSAFYGTGCALAVLGVKVSLTAYTYAGLCFNSAYHHLT